MASEQKRKNVAHQRNGDGMSADYGQRAALALDRCIPGQNRDKVVARLFGVSVRMAQYLRCGQHWTTNRLSQASAVLGIAFDAALYSPAPSVQHYTEMADIEGRLARLEARVAEVDRRSNAGLAPPARSETPAEGGEVAAPMGTRGRKTA